MGLCQTLHIFNLPFFFFFSFRPSCPGPPFLLPPPPPAFKGSKIKRSTRRAELLPGLRRDEPAPLPLCQAAPRCSPAVPAAVAAQLSAPKVGNVAAGAGQRGCSPCPCYFAKDSSRCRLVRSHCPQSLVNARQASRYATRYFCFPKFWVTALILRSSGHSSPHSAAGSGVLLLAHLQPSRESRAIAMLTHGLPSFPTAPCFLLCWPAGWEGERRTCWFPPPQTSFSPVHGPFDTHPASYEYRDASRDADPRTKVVAPLTPTPGW